MQLTLRLQLPFEEASIREIYFNPLGGSLGPTAVASYGIPFLSPWVVKVLYLIKLGSSDEDRGCVHTFILVIIPQTRTFSDCKKKEKPETLTHIAFNSCTTGIFQWPITFSHYHQIQMNCFLEPFEGFWVLNDSVNVVGVADRARVPPRRLLFV